MTKRSFLRRPPRVAVIPLTGVISASQRGLGGGLSDQSLAAQIDRAFTKGKPNAVALLINSPGGSPAQSSLIGARIKRLSKEHKVPVYAFCEDVAASGGYWLACAAEEIFVDENSIVGSIGVISASFGFHELLERNGVERRIHTAGGSKSFMDPFKPENPEDVIRLKALQEDIHQTFIAHVKTSRGDRLVEEDLFTGRVWVGQKSVEVGLADGVGHLKPVMEDKLSAKPKFILYGQRQSLLQKLGLKSALDLINPLEERAEWARYGL
ncbi:MAG: S49 family peptidase [Pseudomonadota bacterium]